VIGDVTVEELEWKALSSSVLATFLVTISVEVVDRQRPILPKPHFDHAHATITL
jgi:hypothetical protein